MKKTKIIYWIVTILIAALMLLSAVPEILQTADADKFFAGIGFPAYMNPFLGVAKILGVIAILIPGYPRIKEWAYAGFAFDLAGATYAQIASGVPPKDYMLMFIWIILLAASYIYYHKKSNLTIVKN